MHSARKLAATVAVLLWGTTAWADGSAVDMCKFYKTHCKMHHHCETVNRKPQCVPEKKKTPTCKPACKTGESCEAVQCIKAPCPNQCVKK